MHRIDAPRPLDVPFARNSPELRTAADSTRSQQGESLAVVAQRSGVAERALRSANPDLTPFDALPAGTVVAMPEPTPEVDVPRIESDDVAGRSGKRDPASPHETLEAIEALPDPDIRDLPPQLPDADRQQILEYRQSVHDAQVVEMAEAALDAAEPPRLSDYAALPPATAQAEYQMAMAQYHADMAGLRAALAEARVGQVESTPGFQALSPEQQQGVRDVLQDPAFQALPLHQQQDVVASMLAGEYYVTGVSAVVDHAFNSGEADAVRFDITIDGDTTPVYVPTEQDPALDYHPLGEVASGLASLPAQSRERIERVDVNPERNPQDEIWEVEYDSPGFRSYMTAGAEGIVSIYPSDGMRPPPPVLEGGLLHEVAHIVEGQDFGETEWAAWEAAMEADGQSV